MRKLLFVFAVGLVVSGCLAVGPAGSWNYTVTGTPQGDFTGEMMVTKNEKGYAAKLSSKDGEIPFNNFVSVYLFKKPQITGHGVGISEKK